MQLPSNLFDIANEILETYDPGRLKKQSIQNVKDERSKIDSKKTLSQDKWDKVSKQIDNDEKMDEAKAKDYKQ